MQESVRPTVTDAEVGMLIQIVKAAHGIDFSGYSKASFIRRVQRILGRDASGDFHILLKRVETDSAYFSRFLNEITVNVTEMFRDPSFFTVLRKGVLPEFNGKKSMKIWHAACSTGEEVFSTAIVLNELRLLTRSSLLGTDLSPDVLEKASRGVYSNKLVEEYQRNYLNSGGQSQLSEYYTPSYGNVVFKDYLRNQMKFSVHNLAEDDPLGEFDLVMCRNVLIYFQKPLQSRVISMFAKSLKKGGYLCLGAKESLMFAEEKLAFEEVDGKEKIYRKR